MKEDDSMFKQVVIKTIGINKEKSVLFKKGIPLSILKWSLFTVLFLSILNYVSIFLAARLILDTKISDIYAFAPFILPSIAYLLIFYFVLKREAIKFKLDSYSLLSSYTLWMLIFIMVLNVIITFILTWQFSFPITGVIPLVLILIVIPILVKRKLKIK